MFRNKYILALGSLFLFLGVQAQTSVISVGVRGGGQLWMRPAGTDIKGQLGGTGTLDLRYTFYGEVSQNVGIGFALGVGVGYGTMGWKGDHIDQYTNTDYLGNQLDYTVTSAWKQQDRLAKVDASLMLSFRFSGVSLHIGPRLMIPFASRSEFTLTETSIDAYYPLYNVHVTDQLITGYLATPYSQAVSSHLPQYNVLMAAEIGYEWALNKGHNLGVQVYAEVMVNGEGTHPFRLGFPRLTGTPSGERLVDVRPIVDAANPVPEVVVNGEGLMVNGERFVGFGLRAYYAFSTEHNAFRRRVPSRDTRKHHNRYLRSNL